MRRAITIGVRMAAWSCVGLIAVLALLPAEEMLGISLGGHIEHAIVYAGVLEWLQHFAPGRHRALADWLASSVGVLIGSGVGYASVFGMPNRSQRWFGTTRRLNLPSNRLDRQQDRGPHHRR